MKVIILTRVFGIRLEESVGVVTKSMDTKRDKDYLEQMWEQGKGPLKSK